VPEVKARGGVWYAVAYYYDAEADARVRVRRSTGIKTAGAGAKRRAEIVAAEIERRLAAGLDRGARATLEDAFTAREKALIVRAAPASTRERSGYSADHVFEVLGPDTAVDALNTQVLTAYASARMDAGASADTVRRELADLRAACGALGVPCPQLPELPRPRVIERWLSADEALRLLAAAPPKRARAIMLALQTGLRKAEVWALRRIAPGLGRLVEGVAGEGEDGLKTGARTIPLTPIAEEILAAGPLEPWHNAGRDLKAYAAAANLGRVTWNDLRASTATLLLLADVPHARIAALLGHKSTRMVERRYARLRSVDVTAEDLAALGALGESAVCQNSSPSGQPEPAPAAENVGNSSPPAS